jgi:hypothetical protein
MACQDGQNYQTLNHMVYRSCDDAGILRHAKTSAILGGKVTVETLDKRGKLSKFARK